MQQNSRMSFPGEHLGTALSPAPARPVGEHAWHECMDSLQRVKGTISIGQEKKEGMISQAGEQFQCPLKFCAAL